MKNSNKEEKEISLWWLILPVLAIILIWFFYEDNHDLNTLFSGLAFAGLIFTILLQRNELKLQRKELEETRKELERSATAQENTEKNLSIQRFETTFFNHLNLHNELINEYNERSNKKTYIKEMYSRLQGEYDAQKPKGKEIIDLSYIFFKSHEHSIGNYFNLFLHILTYVNESKLIEEKDREVYIEALKSKLSYYEIRLIFYFIMGNRLVEYKKILDKYTFFGYLDRLLDDSHLEYYKSLRVVD